MGNNYIASFSHNKKSYQYYSLTKFAQDIGVSLEKIPFSHRVLFENLLRHESDSKEFAKIIQNIKDYFAGKKTECEINFAPARVLMQDFTGVPAVVDLAAMREALSIRKKDPKNINPYNQVDLVIDHSVMVDHFGNNQSLAANTKLEIKRNLERYEFLKWGQENFSNFRVVPPGTGICHQVNLEYLAPVVMNKENLLYPDSLVGTDSHTTMINGLGVLGFGVGGIEAEAAMLSQPISMILPKTVGFALRGQLAEGVTATDLVLTITEKLRAHGVVGKFVEFHGPALKGLSLANRATIANMAPEYGATCGFFPLDNESFEYMHLTGRDEDHIELAKLYAKESGFFNEGNDESCIYDENLDLDLSIVEPSLAGPKRPQDRHSLSKVPASFRNSYRLKDRGFAVKGQDYALGDGDIVIAAITSCTNTSNPEVMLAAGLVAKKARALGLTVKPYVKTSLAPGSQVVSEYLKCSGLQDDLDALGFNVVGYGCTTCIGNSGPLAPEIEECARNNNLSVASVLSGNRNFEGRVHPLTKANYLASPPLVVAYAIFGKIDLDITKSAIGETPEGKLVYLRDIWPSNQEIKEIVKQTVTREMFKQKYANIFAGDQEWQAIKTVKSETYAWQEDSTYVKNPPFFSNLEQTDLTDIKEAKIIALLGDSITTDHISPAGAIAKNSPAAAYLAENGIEPADFNSYGSRRGNHEVMMRGTFANIRIRNEMLDEEGGYTIYHPSKETMSIYDAAMKYQQDGTELVVVAGKEYGTGSSRDWAAKGTRLLGIKAVVAESFERIHRSNLIGMGVLPLQFKEGDNRKTLNLNGKEKISLIGMNNLKALGEIDCQIEYENGEIKTNSLKVRIDTELELDNYKNGGILQRVVKQYL